MTPDERQRTFIGLLLAAYDIDEPGFLALLSGMPRSELVTLIRSLAEVVVGGQVAMEEWPGDARREMARQALTLAARAAELPSPAVMPVSRTPVHRSGDSGPD